MRETDTTSDAGTYAQLVLVVMEHAPLLGRPRPARIALDTLRAAAPDAPGKLWGVLVLPDTIRLVVGPLSEGSELDPFVETLKRKLATQLIGAIHQTDDNTLDDVLRFNPVYGGTIWRIWQPGYHRTIFRGNHRLARTLDNLRLRPIHLGLVQDVSDWPYSWFPAE